MLNEFTQRNYSSAGKIGAWISGFLIFTQFYVSRMKKGHFRQKFFYYRNGKIVLKLDTLEITKGHFEFEWMDLIDPTRILQ